MFKSKSLTPAILKIVRDKGTEHPFTGAYYSKSGTGTYLCRQCGLALFRSSAQFESGCGWPSFDSEVNDNVIRAVDADGVRTEILCQRCRAHLGHVFSGERLTPLNIRHCVNSLSLDFVTDPVIEDTEEAIFAAGCFWGVEYFFKKLTGVLKTEVGYIGGHQDNPTYETVCAKKTDHVEGIRVIYDPQKIDFEKLAKYFFEIHDPTQLDGQGPDLGEQYLSVIFYYDVHQKRIASQLVNTLESKGLRVATTISPVNVFWPAEDYHQDYYQKTGKYPYCHRYVKLF